MTKACNIITDSPCDLQSEYLREHDVRLLHFTYTEVASSETDKKDRPLLNGLDDVFESVSAHDFYDSIRNGAKPMTSQPSQGEIEKVFREAIAEGIPAVYLCFSSGISGCYGGACAVLDRLKEEMGEDIELYIVDTRLGSTPQALLVSEAIRQRNKGISATQLVKWAEEARFYIHTMFMVDDLQALRRGGRIPAGLAMAGSMLNVKPLLTFDLDGRLTMMGMSRGRKKAIRKMATYYEENHNTDIYSALAAVGSADCPKDLKKLEQTIQKYDDSTIFMESSIGPTIGCHVGPDMLSIAFWGPDRRDDQSISDSIAEDVCKQT